MLTVPAESAGKQFKCPLCSGTFQVPVLPQTPQEHPVLGDLPAEIPLTPLPSAPHEVQAPASEASEEPMYQLIPEPPKPSPPPPSRREPSVSASGERESVQQPSSKSAPPPAGYEKHHVFQLRPIVLPWTSAVALGLLLVLWFFPWVGTYPGGYSVYSQNAFQILGGGHSADPVGEKVLGKEDRLRENISGDWLLLLYFPAVLAALGLAVLSLVLGRKSARLPPAVQQIWPWRLAIIGVTAGLAFLILLLQLWMGFGLENGLAKIVDAGLENKRTAATTPEEKQRLEIERGSQLGSFVIERTSWYRLALLCHVVAVSAAGLEIWMARRGNKPLPQLQVDW
jgi:hypothetical protein